MKLPDRIAIIAAGNAGQRAVVARYRTAAARDARIHLNAAAPDLTDASMNRDGA